MATALRGHLAKLTNPTTAAFVNEAISCYEAGLFRSAIVMSWIAATHVLYEWVVQNKLPEFNLEAKRVDAGWRNAATADDLANMKEFNFLERLHGIGAITKNAKERLQTSLRLRNGCGHPNSLRVGEHQTAAHIEILLMNVFEKFSI